MQVENIEKKIDLTKSLKDIEKFEEIIEIVERNFKKNFEMNKENFNQIEKLKENRWIAHNDSKNIAELIDDENKVFKNNIININFNYNVVEDAIIVVKTENKTLQDIALKSNFWNKHIRKNAFDENIKFLIK